MLLFSRQEMEKKLFLHVRFDDNWALEDRVSSLFLPFVFVQFCWEKKVNNEAFLTDIIAIWGVITTTGYLRRGLRGISRGIMKVYSWSLTFAQVTFRGERIFFFKIWGWTNWHLPLDIFLFRHCLEVRWWHFWRLYRVSQKQYTLSFTPYFSDLIWIFQINLPDLG